MADVKQFLINGKKEKESLSLQVTSLNDRIKELISEKTVQGDKESNEQTNRLESQLKEKE